MLHDFKFLFGSNVISKVLGICRQMLIAYIFGTDPRLGVYFALIAYSDIISLFANNSVLNSIIIPKYSRYTNQEICLSEFNKRNKFYFGILYLASILLNIIVVFISDIEIDIFVAFLLLSTSCLFPLSFIVDIYLGLIQSLGLYKNYSKIGITNSATQLSIAATSFIFNVFGLLLSRLLAMCVSIYMSVKNIRIKDSLNKQILPPLKFSAKDFSVVIGANVFIILVLVYKLVFTIFDQDLLIIFNYAIVITSVVFTLFIKNFNDVLLRTISLSKRRGNKLLYIGYFVALISICGFFYVLAEPISKIIYLRGNFDAIALKKVVLFVKYSMIIMALIGINDFLYQFILVLKKSKELMIFIIWISIPFLIIPIIYRDDWVYLYGYSVMFCFLVLLKEMQLLFKARVFKVFKR